MVRGCFSEATLVVGQVRLCEKKVLRNPKKRVIEKERLIYKERKGEGKEEREEGRKKERKKDMNTERQT